MTPFCLEFIVVLALAYLIYRGVLKKTTLFNFTRFFLLSTLVLSLVSPFIKFETSYYSPAEFAKKVSTNFTAISSETVKNFSSEIPKEIEHNSHLIICNWHGLFIWQVQFFYSFDLFEIFIL